MGLPLRAWRAQVNSEYYLVAGRTACEVMAWLVEHLRADDVEEEMESIEIRPLFPAELTRGVQDGDEILTVAQVLYAMQEPGMIGRSFE